MTTLAETCTMFLIAIKELVVIINGERHGILQGTHEAVLAEAQGAQVGPAGRKHLVDLQGTLRDVTARENDLKRVLDRFAAINPNVATRLRRILDPLLRQSASYRSAMVQTEQHAADLARTDGTRLSGVMFEEGKRSAKALISSQMQTKSQQFIGRGIEPRLIPAANNAGTQVMATIRQLPITIDDAKVKVVAVVASMRVLVTQAARAALVAGHAALSAALTALEAALVAAASRLTSPIILINTPSIRRALGLPVAEDGA